MQMRVAGRRFDPSTWSIVLAVVLPSLLAVVASKKNLPATVDGGEQQHDQGPSSMWASYKKYIEWH
jgi:hypothetical protein